MIVIIVSTILAITVALLYIWWHIVYFRLEKYLKNIPGPPVIPIIGNIHHVGLDRELIPSLMTCHEKHGDMIKFMFGYVPKLCITGQKQMEFLLSSPFIIDKSYDYDFFHPWLGLGLLTSTGKQWKQRRKLLTPAFHFQILENFIDVFEKQSNILINKLNKHDQQEVDVFPFIRLLALDIICEATMHTSVNAQDSDSEYFRAVKEVCRIMISRGISILKYPDFLFRLTVDFYKQRKLLKTLHGFTNTVIKRRKEELKWQSLSSENESGKKCSFLDILLQSFVDGKPLSNEAIREEVDTFMFEGHDTITSAISFTLYCLSKYQNVQEKVVEELQIISKNNEPLTYNDLQSMKYLDQVIKEVMRLYPPVPMFGRKLNKDVCFDGHILPKGLTILIFSYALHRQKSVFPNPENFDPDRFSLENSRERSLYSYIPFSAGPRNCIGQRFAMLEVKSVISKVLKHFKLLPVIGHEPDLISHAILNSYNGLPVKLQKRSEYL